MSADAQHLTRARFAELERQLAAAMAQRDELLDALIVLEEFDFNDSGEEITYDRACRKARAAIAKAQST